jgi:hypothetical protein
MNTLLVRTYLFYQKKNPRCNMKLEQLSMLKHAVCISLLIILIVFKLETLMF